MKQATHSVIHSTVHSMILPTILAGLFLTLAGCGAKSMVVLLPDPDGHVGRVTVANKGGERVLAAANESVGVTAPDAPPGEVKKLTDKDIRKTFAEAMDAQPTPPAVFILYFLTNSNELTPESQKLLPEIIRTIQERDSTDIVIAGHTDKVGAKEYNYRLSLERAKVLYEILATNGATPENITVTSHGEGNPLIKTADEVPEPRNRRVEVVIK